MREEVGQESRGGGVRRREPEAIGVVIEELAAGEVELELAVATDESVTLLVVGGQAHKALLHIDAERLRHLGQARLRLGLAQRRRGQYGHLGHILVRRDRLGQLQRRAVAVVAARVVIAVVGIGAVMVFDAIVELVMLLGDDARNLPAGQAGVGGLEPALAQRIAKAEVVAEVLAKAGAVGHQGAEAKDEMQAVHRIGPGLQLRPVLVGQDIAGRKATHSRSPSPQVLKASFGVNLVSFG
ncbi:hypothetical protein HC891_15120 [Candidatus Gracilibacteria bacterium]|nr:hypothetical protein [Candidatus Gracilibacteria bacterium]